MIDKQEVTEIRYVLDLTNVSQDDVLELLDTSSQNEYVEVTNDTLCLFDISSYENVEYQTLIIQCCGRIYKSKSLSNKLLTDFANKFNSFHEATRYVAYTLNYKQKIPYVIGNKGFIPSDGYSKQTVSWVALDNIKRLTEDSNTCQVHLISTRGFVLVLPMSKFVFEQQLNRTARILKRKKVLLNGVLTAYVHTLNNSQMKKRNILLNEMDVVAFEYPNLTYKSMLEILIEQEVNKRLKNLLGEGNPYYDDYLQK